MVGNTGAGKSVFVNDMLGCTMYEVVDENTGDTVIDCESPIAPIGHTKLSETYLASVYTHGRSPFAFVDSPGFDDNRGVDVEIANMFSIARVAKCAKKILGVVFLVSFHTLQSVRGKGLRSAAAMMASIFGESNWKSPAVTSNTLFLVTATPVNRTRDQLRHIIQDIVHDTELIPQVLVQAVDAYDPLADSTSRFLHRDDILQRLQSFRGIPSTDLNFTLSAESTMIIDDTLEALVAMARKKFHDKHYAEVAGIMTSLESFLMMDNDRLQKKLDTLQEQLSADVRAMAADDTSLETLRMVKKDLSCLSEACDEAIEHIAAKQRLLEAKKRAEQEARQAKEREQRAEQEAKQAKEREEQSKAVQRKAQEEYEREQRRIRLELEKARRTQERVEREAKEARERSERAARTIQYSDFSGMDGMGVFGGRGGMGGMGCYYSRTAMVLLLCIPLVCLRHRLHLSPRHLLGHGTHGMHLNKFIRVKDYLPAKCLLSTVNRDAKRRIGVCSSQGLSS